MKYGASWCMGLASVMAFAMAGCGDDTSGAGGGGTTSTSSSSSSSGGSGPGGGSQGGGGEGGSMPLPACLPAEGSVTAGSDVWVDGTHQASVTISDRESCTRSYALGTTGPLRDDNPANPRTVVEQPGQPVLRSGHDMFDALYALALEEVRENSVDGISNFAFNDGQTIPCAPGGCFETGRLWTYVWTRDTAYAVDLGLALLDPTRAKNSLEFKTSLRRDNTKREIVQDTGTGGSWPVSSDRAVWSLGAWELLKFLDGAERTGFRDLAYDAAVNTVERDRLVVFDPRDGLYRGEQSFLDWREQTYPAWTATDTAQIAMSKALGTNVGHLRLLELASELATEKGLTAAATKYQGWADELRTALRTRLWVEADGMFSTYVPTTLDPAPVRRYDLLGESLAILHGVATPQQAARIVESYPLLPKGPAVVWPQQQDVRVYHNRGIWPFVTSYWLRAAARVGNAPAIDHAVASLVRGAALNLSNMENFEAVTGENWHDDGAMSGPVVNSQRQLWSVAGYVSMVHDVVFGLEATQAGLRFAPKLTRELRRDLFGGSTEIALSNLAYKGRRVSVSLRLPEAATGNGVLEVASVRVNGVEVGTGFVDASSLPSESHFEVTLAEGSTSDDTIELLSSAEITEYKNLFGPKTPSITALTLAGDRIRLDFNRGGELAGDVVFDVLRDGVVIAEGLPGTTTSYTDDGSAQHATRSYCYTVRTRFASGAASQHARAACYWGPATARIQTFGAQSFAVVGGSPVNQYGRFHYQGWGDPSHTITVSGITPTVTGRHLVQVLAGNGAGGYDTGITCAVKAVEVFDGATYVGGGQLVMPHLATWDDWRDSSFVEVDLMEGKSYTIVIREDESSGNMSELGHFALYGGTGGTAGRFNRVNIAELKLLAIGD
jgi:hypothetical protein